MVNPYFVAVIDGSVDGQKLLNIMGNLPGVVSINEAGAEADQGKLQKLMGQLGSDYTLSADMLNFKSIRVIMNPSLSPESLQFVRDQAVKLGGKEHVSATEVKFPEVTKVMKSHPFYSFISKAGDWGVVVVLAIFWIVSYWLCYDVFRSRSYIIEKFQRKKLVAAKSIASGLGFVMLTFVGLGIFDGTLKFFDIVILFMVFSIFWTFSMQDWRWKPTL